MRRLRKKILTAIAALSVACMALAGCGSAELAPANQTVGAIFELTAKSNMTPMKDLLGFASEDDVRSTFLAEGSDSDDLVSQFQAQFTAEGVTMSDESVKEFADVLEEILARLTYTTEIISEDKETVVVSLKVNSYSAADMEQVTLDALTAMQERLTEEDQMAIMNGDNDILTSYMEGYFSDLVSGLSAMEISSEPVAIEVSCEKMLVDVSGKEKTAWMPSDLGGFYEDIEASIFH
ncbi:hypothetical protein D5282_16405 [bacterium 1xD8-48]|jgi:hypothetical protein|nr:hypothetical protein [Lachnospiraceae bacterium]MCI9327738.1 hypothetical protein [Lachnospiraceae bacterium]NBJ98856.1 hypothetical protein [bacterium 1xD8-48]